MPGELRTIDDLDVAGRRVFLRADLNVPLTPAWSGTPVDVADDSRIRAALPTINELRARGARLILASHLGRPKGHDPALSMRPVAARLSDLIGVPVALAPDVVGPAVLTLTEALVPGEVMMLENVRYERGETKNDAGLVSALAELADVYVDDAFGTAHRAHATTEGIAHLLPCAAGRLMEREVATLSSILAEPRRPLVAVLGGAKVADKIGVVERFLEIADVLCVGGAMAFPFLAAQGHRVGDSRCADEDVETARRVMTAVHASRCRLELPHDLLLARTSPGLDGSESAPHHLDGIDVPRGWAGLDIGPATAAWFGREIGKGGTVFWNGPMGRFEQPAFAGGTRAVAQAIASASAISVAGGGETVEALRMFGLAGEVTHVSTGGGATLEFLEGRELPGVTVLRTAAPAMR